MRPASSALWVVLVLAGGCDDAARRGRPAPDPTDAGSTTSFPTPTTTPPPDTSTPTVEDPGTTPPLDCTVLPTVTSLTSRPFEASEDFTFGTDGKLYGVQLASNGLIRTDSYGQHEVLVPFVSTWGRGTRFLPGGDLVVAEPDSGALLRFDAVTWGETVVRGDLTEPNGIAIGEDGAVYLTQLTGEVLRIDPDTGDSTTIFETPDSTDGIAFSPDFRTLYWNSEGGQVMRVELDAAGALVTEPELFVTLDVEYMLDGMTVDACGNLYVVDMLGTIWLVTPDGQASVLADLALTPGGFSISALNHGTGVGNWGATKLYVMSLNNWLHELEVGLPGKHEPHWP